MKNIQFLPVLPVAVISFAVIFISGCLGAEDRCRDVHQDNQLPNYTVSIEIINPSQDAPVTAQFTPTKGAAKVEYAFGHISDMESFESGTLAGVRVNEGDASFSWLLNEERDLEANEEYSVFARALGDKGEKYPVAVQNFTLYAADNSYLTVTPYYLSDVSAGFRVECSDKVRMVKGAFGRQEDRQAFIDNTLKGVEEFEEPYLVQYFNDYDLEPDSEYVFYCKGATLMDNQTILYAIPFKTKSQEESAPDVEVEYENNVFLGSYSVIPNDLCGTAFFAVVKQWEYDYMINEPYEYAGNISGVLIDCADFMYPFEAVKVERGNTGTMGFVTTELTVDFPLELYVSIYDLQDELYCVKRHNLSTPSFDEGMGEAAVEITMSDVTPNGATFGFAPNANTLLFSFEVYDKDYYEQISGRINAGELDEYFIHTELLSDGYFQYIYDPIDPYTAMECEPDTEYYFVLAPMNFNGILGWGTLNVIPFRTAEI